MQQDLAVTEGSAPQPMGRDARWQSWAAIPLDRLPLSNTYTALLLGLLVLGEQILEHRLTVTTLETEDTGFPYQRLVLPVLMVYMVLVWKVLRRETLKALRQLRTAVDIDDEEYDRHVEAMLHHPTTTYAALAAMAVWIVVLLYMVLRHPFPVYSQVFLPANRPLALYFVGSYVLVGWVGLSLSFTAFKHGWAMGALARRPLKLNVLDANNTLPFGRHSLFHSATLAGIILILLVVLGQPGHIIDYFVIFVAAGASVLTLIVPLWGVHTQMMQVKQQALAKICAELDKAHTVFMSYGSPTTAELEALTHRIDKLTTLRGLMLKAPNWPFRDATAIARALTAATSPLVYVVLTALIETYVLPMFR